MLQAKYKLEIALEELREQYKQLNLNATILDDKLKNLASNSSILVTLFGGLNSSSFLDVDCLLALIVACFILLLATCFIALWPKRYPTPFDTLRGGVEKTIYKQSSHRDVLDQLVVNYTARIGEITQLNNSKSAALKLGYALFSLVAVLALVFSFS